MDRQTHYEERTDVMDSIQHAQENTFHFSEKQFN